MNNFDKEKGESQSMNLKDNITSDENNADEKEEEFTMKEYLDNVNKELLVISKFEKDDQVKKCTYDKGYIAQEIYVCVTCSKEKNSLTGMCVGCAYKCHENHQVENLHFKRKFRCDCGNSNYFNSCELQTDKEVLNLQNNYNHNFNLKYCKCDSEEKDEMIQCLICEDWFHFGCLKFDGLFEFAENPDLNLVCCKCLNEKLSFLIDYPDFSNILKIKKDIEIKNKEKETLEGNLNKEFFENNKPKELNLLGKKRNNFFDEKPITPNDNNVSNIFFQNKVINEKSNLISDNNLELNEPFDNKEIKESSTQTDLIQELKKNSESFCPFNETIKNNYFNEFSHSNIKAKDENLKISKIIFDNNLDIIIDINLLFKLLCKCEKCLKLYNEKYVGFIATKEELIDDWNNRELLEDKLDEQANLDNEENKEIINKIDNFDFNLLPEVRNLPIEKQIVLNRTMNNFSAIFSEYVQKNPPKDNLISGEYIKNFFIEFNSKKKDFIN